MVLNSKDQVTIPASGPPAPPAPRPETPGEAV